jgi:hypothetical protein
MRESELNPALLLPRLSNGVSSKALGLCWGPAALGAVMAGGENLLYAPIPLLIGATVHAVIAWAYRKDPHAFEIYIQYARMAKRYHPDSREHLPPTFERPHRLGRGVRM